MPPMEDAPPPRLQGMLNPEHKAISTNLSNLLPGNETCWKDCSLGPASQWTESLQAYSITISSFSYPAAIFWGDEFVLLHNEAWSKSNGGDEQGQKQRGKLNPDAWNVLNAALHGGRPKRLDSGQLLQNDASSREYSVLVCPLFDDNEDSKASGLLAQLIPKPNMLEPRADESRTSDAQHTNLTQQPQKFDAKRVSGADDNVPLDEHPFFHRFAEMLPTGLAILDHKAQAVFVNQHFYELTTHKDDDKSFTSWPQSIHPDDYQRVMEAYQLAFTSQTQLRTEFRSLGENHPWRLLLLTPLGDENLRHVSLREYGGFICSIVDISSEKSAELAERKAAREAQKRKEQQERFIDMISHEIRNPLGAILHCIEDIDNAAQPGATDIEAIHESVETIHLCIGHQQNIVDDVLSFSKLDASMLSLVPKPCEPARQLANSVKMFQPEFRKQGMEFKFRIDPSYSDCGVKWVMADLARITQILINLVTNAIKFTVHSEHAKQVTVHIGASKDQPKSYPLDVVFLNSDDVTHSMDATRSNDWGAGETMYLMIAVEDTGIGIDDEGQKRLFERFRQVTPKTGEIYGGSGLGLNISRKLCHLHGGEIGVSSKVGQGSTFGFYFKVKRAESVPDSSEQEAGEADDAANQKDQIEELGITSPDDVNQTATSPLKTPPITRQEELVRNPDSYSRDGQSNSMGPPPRDYLSASTSNTQRPGLTPKHSSGDRMLTHNSLDPPAHAQQHVKVLPRQNGDRARVLLVEDNVINQRLVHRKLESKGFSVTLANNGQEAIDAVREAANSSGNGQGAFDVVLMDQEMPVVDGNTATKEIRGMERSGEVQHVPILGVTANVRDVQQDDMIESGMDDVISKPYKIDEMVEKIHEMTGGG